MHNCVRIDRSIRLKNNGYSSQTTAWKGRWFGRYRAMACPLAVDAGFDTQLLKRPVKWVMQRNKGIAISDKAWDESTSGFRIGLEMADYRRPARGSTHVNCCYPIPRRARRKTLARSGWSTVCRGSCAWSKGLCVWLLWVVLFLVITQCWVRPRHKDNIRKMLVALVDDVQVALIKLSERTCTIRIVKNNPAKRYRVAQVHDIYAPLAHRWVLVILNGDRRLIFSLPAASCL